MANKSQALVRSIRPTDAKRAMKQSTSGGPRNSESSRGRNSKSHAAAHLICERIAPRAGLILREPNEDDLSLSCRGTQRPSVGAASWRGSITFAMSMTLASVVGVRAFGGQFNHLPDLPRVSLSDPKARALAGSGEYRNVLWQYHFYRRLAAPKPDSSRPRSSRARLECLRSDRLGLSHIR